MSQRRTIFLGTPVELPEVRGDFVALGVIVSRSISEEGGKETEFLRVGKFKNSGLGGLKKISREEARELLEKGRKEEERPNSLGTLGKERL